MNALSIDFLKSATLGILASLSIFICIELDLPAWVLFIGWSSHGLFCEKPKHIFPTLFQETAGMLLAFLINILGTSISEKSYGVLISVFLVVGLLFWGTKLKKLNNITAYFMGMTAWFSFQSNDLEDVLILILSLLFGFCFGLAYSYLSQIIDSQNK